MTDLDHPLKLYALGAADACLFKRKLSPLCQVQAMTVTMSATTMSRRSLRQPPQLTVLLQLARTAAQAVPQHVLRGSVISTAQARVYDYAVEQFWAKLVDEEQPLDPLRKVPVHLPLNDGGRIPRA